MDTSILSTFKSTAPVETGISSIIDSSVQPTFQNIAPMVRDTSLNMDTSILSTFKSTAPVETGISSIIDSSVQPTFQNIASNGKRYITKYGILQYCSNVITKYGLHH